MSLSMMVTIGIGRSCISGISVDEKLTISGSSLSVSWSSVIGIIIVCVLDSPGTNLMKPPLLPKSLSVMECQTNINS